MKKKILLTLLALVCALCCAFGLVACGDVAVTSVTLNKTELTLAIDGEETLTATVKPDDATDKTVTWSVSPAGIVTVDNGKVTAVAEGAATVTATAGDKSATCSVKVNSAVCGTYVVYWMDDDAWVYDNEEAIINDDNTWSFDGDNGTYEVNNGVYNLDLLLSSGFHHHIYATLDGNILWLYDHEADVDDIHNATGFAYKGTEISAADKTKIETSSGIEIEAESGAKVTAEQWQQSFEGLNELTAFTFENGGHLPLTIKIAGVKAYYTDSMSTTTKCESIYVKDGDNYFDYEGRDDVWTRNAMTAEDYNAQINSFKVYVMLFPVFADDFDSFDYDDGKYECTTLNKNMFGEEQATVCNNIEVKFENGILVSVKFETANSDGYFELKEIGMDTIEIPTDYTEADVSTEGVSYTPSSDGSSYYVSGIGTATDTDIVIASVYGEERLPVTSIGDGAFQGCTSITSVVIPDSVTSIGNRAFYGCTSLESVNIPDRLTEFGASAFFNCTSLTAITIPDTVTYIGDHAFRDCSSLTGVIKIPDGKTSINPYLFYKTKITGIIIPKSVTSVYTNAFYNCSSLANVYYQGSAEDWGRIVVENYNTPFKNALRYYYSETKPTETGNYWHYAADGVTPVKWVVETE